MARILLALALSLLSLAAHAAAIADILRDPRMYVDKTVVVDGEVASAFSLVWVKYFSVDDGSGTIAVVTTQTLPRKGQRIRVFGKVKEVLSLGSESLIVLFEQEAPATSV